MTIKTKQEIYSNIRIVKMAKKIDFAKQIKTLKDEIKFIHSFVTKDTNHAEYEFWQQRVVLKEAQIEALQKKQDKQNGK